MKTYVIASSKTGFTRRYARWIAEETNGTLLAYKDFMELPVDAEDIVIFGSRVHAGKIEHLSKVKARLGEHGAPNLIVFATGATPIAAEDVIQKIWANNLSKTELETIPHFYMQSGLDYEKMGFFDRIIMKMAAMVMGGKKTKDDNEAGFELAIKRSHDISSREYIAPLVDFFKRTYGIG